MQLFANTISSPSDALSLSPQRIYLLEFSRVVGPLTKIVSICHRVRLVRRSECDSPRSHACYVTNAVAVSAATKANRFRCDLDAAETVGFAFWSV